MSPVAAAGLGPAPRVRAPVRHTPRLAAAGSLATYCPSGWDVSRGGTIKTEKGNGNTDVSTHYQRLELLITGMTCSHCAESVRHAIAECSGVRSAEVVLKRGRAIVMGDNLDQERLKAAVEGLGYTVKMPTASDTADVL